MLSVSLTDFRLFFSVSLPARHNHVIGRNYRVALKRPGIRIANSMHCRGALIIYLNGPIPRQNMYDEEKNIPTHFYFILWRSLARGVGCENASSWTSWSVEKLAGR